MEIVELISKIIAEETKNPRIKIDGINVQKRLKENGFLSVREIKQQYRKFYEMGIVSFTRSKFPSEVVECGFGGNTKKSILIHPSTIENAINKFEV